MTNTKSLQNLLVYYFAGFLFMFGYRCKFGYNLATTLKCEKKKSPVNR
jgi:hypothetical protein